MFRSAKMFALVWLCLGLGVGGYYAQQWHELPVWDETEIEQSVELNLALDLQRMGPHLRPQGEKLEALRQLIHSEVETEIGAARRTVQRGLLAGLLLMAVGGVALWLTRPQSPM